MRTNGTIVYRISIGMLYRTCGGSLLPRWGWEIRAPMIRPHTTAPTSRPAIHEPCQRDSVIAPCLVTGSGKPRRVKGSFGEHPARASSKTASAPTRTTLARCHARGWACVVQCRARLARPGESESKERLPKQRRPAACYLLQAPVFGLLQRVVETLSRPAVGSQGTPAVRAVHRNLNTQCVRAHLFAYSRG